MKSIINNIIIASFALSALACSKEDDNVITPTSPEDFPLQIVLDSDEEGNVEDDDNAELVFTFTDRMDLDGEELGGIIVPLSNPVTIRASISETEGFSEISEYILGMEAYYEIDDCTTSLDMDEDLDLEFDPNSGEFSFTFPAGVEEVIVEMELDEELFDDDVVSDDRGFTVSVLGISGETENVVINTDVEFEYKVLDDELFFGEYELVMEEDNFNNFKTLFQGVSEDLAELAFADADAVEAEAGLEDFGMVVILNETEMVTECDETEEVNLEIEIEGEFEELTDDETSGDIEFIVEIEDDRGILEEIGFSGSFGIDEDTLTLTLESEDLETGEIELLFVK